MRIAYIGVKGIPYGGGIEKVTEEIGSRLVAKGHTVTVFCDRRYCNSSSHYKGMEIRALPSMSHLTFRKFSNSLFGVFEVIFTHNADVVHLHGVSALFAPVLRMSGARIVAHIHSFEWRKNKWNRMARFFLRVSDYFALWFTDRIIVVSDSLFDYFTERCSGKVFLLPNGVGKHDYVPPNLIREFSLSRNNYILYIGRLSREKGLDYLIEEYGYVCTEKALALAGDFADNVQFRRGLLNKIGKNKRILVLGYADGEFKAELLSNAYFVIFPSEIEGSPLALLEAMSYGNCCVASDVKEHLEIMNGYGYTFRTGDRDDLRMLLSRLLFQKRMVDQYKDKAKMHVVQKHDWDKVVDSYEYLYRSLLPKIGERSS